MVLSPFCQENMGRSLVRLDSNTRMTWFCATSLPLDLVTKVESRTSIDQYRHHFQYRDGEFQFSRHVALLQG